MKYIIIKDLQTQINIKNDHFDVIFYCLIWFENFEQILLPPWLNETQIARDG